MVDPKAELRDALRRELRYEIWRGRGRVLLWSPQDERQGADVPPVDDRAAAPAEHRAGAAEPAEPILTFAPAAMEPQPVFIKRGSGANAVPAWLDEERALQFMKTRDTAIKCKKCGLWKTRTHVVFGTGSGKTGVMFIGEAPGRDEDLTGEPFVGRAGQLLTKVLAALDWAREDVYIANVLKCRPPENRDPQPDEVATCSPYLLRQIGLLQPKILCALGNYAAQLLLNSRSSMARLRGRLLDFQGTPLIATYHPAAILRNPNLKKPLWEDMQLLKKTYESLSGGA